MQADLGREQALQWALAQAIHQGAATLPEGWQGCARAVGRLGLATHQAHAAAQARRALSLSHPVLTELVGEDGLAALAQGLWAADPPRSGDLGDWGESLPTLIAGRPELAGEPYLADVARLEWQVHRAARAADTPAAVSGLALLAEADPASLVLRMRAGLGLQVSAWPVASIWLAHQRDRSEAFLADAWSQARAGLAARQGQTAVVWRSGWRVQVQALPPPWTSMMQALCEGQTLGRVLDEHDPALFEPWLLQALQLDWLAAVEPLTET